MADQRILLHATTSVSPERAFDAFLGEIGRWWPKGMNIGPGEQADIVIEPFPGGRWFERSEAGTETEWGRVLTWERPAGARLAWQIGADWTFDPDLETQLSVTFEPEGSGARVTLAHAGLERFGDATQAMIAQLGEGWPDLLQRYADYAERDGT